MMKLELNDQECNNVKVALLQLAKSPQVNEEGMKVLLVLSDKFTVAEPKSEKKEEK